MCTSLNTYGRVFLYSGAGVKVGYDVRKKIVLIGVWSSVDCRARGYL